VRRPDRSPTYGTPTPSSLPSIERRRARLRTGWQAGHRHSLRPEHGRHRWALWGCGPEGRGFESPRSPQGHPVSVVLV